MIETPSKWILTSFQWLTVIFVCMQIGFINNERMRPARQTTLTSQVNYKQAKSTKCNFCTLPLECGATCDLCDNNNCNALVQQYVGSIIPKLNIYIYLPTPESTPKRTALHGLTDKLTPRVLTLWMPQGVAYKRRWKKYTAFMHFNWQI